MSQAEVVRFPIDPRMVAPEKVGTIYFIRNDEAKVYKIGWAAHPWSRLRTVQTGNHQKLHLEEWFNTVPGSEAILHRAFASAHIRGEWFHDCYEILSFLEDLEEYKWEHARLTATPEILEQLDDVFLAPDAVQFILDTCDQPWACRLADRPVP